jgi:virginiamycin B lyase
VVRQLCKGFRPKACGFAVFLLALAWSSPAAAQGGHIYWVDQSANSIGRAKIDGTEVNPSFIAGLSAPRGVAVAGARLFFAHGGTPGRIGRARRDGSSVNQSLVTTASPPQGVAVDQAGLYWTHTLPSGGRIGRAQQSGVGANPSFQATGASPCGPAVDFDRLYWANGATNAIGSSHGPFNVNQAYVPGAQGPCGVAITKTHLYWANRAGNSIGRAAIDGSGANQGFIPASGPCGVTVDANYVYWSNSGGTLGRARLDGTGVEQSFITGAQAPCGVAVDPTVTAAPASHTFRTTRVRGNSAIKDFFLQNTSSSALGVFRITTVGPNARDFQKTADACVVNLVPAGAGCPMNVRFRPTGNGTRRAALRITSSASTSPTDIPLTGRGDGVRPRFRRAAFRGSAFRYSLSERARVTFTLARRSRRGGRFRRVARFSQRGKRGRNVKRRRLRRGSYRATLRAKDAAGNVSRRRVVRFRIGG